MVELAPRVLVVMMKVLVLRNPQEGSLKREWNTKIQLPFLDLRLSTSGACSITFMSDMYSHLGTG